MNDASPNTMFPDGDQDVKFYTADVMFHDQQDIKIFTLSAPRKSGDEYHSHEYMQIMFVLRGICHHWIGGKVYDLVRGDGFVIPPYQVHKTDLDDEAHIFCCEFLISTLMPGSPKSHDDFLLRTRINLSFISFFLSEETDIKPRISFSAEEEAHLEHLIRAMLLEYRAEKRYRKEMLNLYIQELLIFYARKYDSMTHDHDTRQLINRYQSAVYDAARYVNDHYAQPITLGDICQVTAVSKTYFCYLFKLITGKTFVNYLNDVRIKHAARLLDGTNMTITQICYEVGFKTLSHFARTFVKAMGVSAMAYRMRNPK